MPFLVQMMCYIGYSLFLFSLTPSLSFSPGCSMCLHTRQPPAWLDLTHGVLGRDEAHCLLQFLISLYVRLHQTQTIRVWSSQLSRLQALKLSSGSLATAASRVPIFTVSPLLPSYTNLDTTATLDCHPDSWWLMADFYHYIDGVYSWRCWFQIEGDITLQSVFNWECVFDNSFAWGMTFA